MTSYKQKNYEQALIETYLKFDELLRLEKVNHFLKNNLYNSKEARLDITFSYASQSVFSPGLDYDGILRNESENKENIGREIFDGGRNKKRLKESFNSNKNETHPTIPKENIIDLTKRDVLTSLSSNNSNEENSKSLSKEILTMDNKKIEISLKNSNLKSDIYEELIAKDMGTTANILLIKNNYLYLANVGDSMAVIFKNGIATRLNQEHKTTLPSEFTRISKSGARIMNNRIEGRLNLTRAIGRLT
jgi:hypothetical protein